jgi:putative ATP-dependent DNA ligase
MSNSEIQRALAEDKAVEVSIGELSYLRVYDDLKGIPRGTVMFGGNVVVYGYPHIGRIAALGRGLGEQFQAPFWIEEKIDGYNVRIVRVGERVLALTRGGFVCPFTTDRLPDLLSLTVFEDHPELVVCAEVAGPENPYNEAGPPFVAEDVRLFVFDLMRIGSTGFIPHGEKQALAERYGLPTVECFGRYTADDLEAIGTILVRLNEEGREGVVFKEDSPRDHRAKYITAAACIQDLRIGARVLLDLPPEYFVNRLLQLAVFVEEHGLEGAQRLGEAVGAALLEGLEEAIRLQRSEQKVLRHYRCRLRSPGAAERLIEHLARETGHQVQVLARDLHREQGHWVLEFDRVYPSTSGTLNSLLGGRLTFD